jgi:hypothetical protein
MMKRLVVLVLVATGLLFMLPNARSGACTMTTECPADGQLAVLLEEQAASGLAITGVYVHRPLAGLPHKFIKRCQ